MARPMPVAILNEFMDGPIKKLLVDLELGELKPGPYTLSLIAKEKGGPVEARANAAITVK